MGRHIGSRSIRGGSDHPMTLKGGMRVALFFLRMQLRSHSWPTATKLVILTHVENGPVFPETMPPMPTAGVPYRPQFLGPARSRNGKQQPNSPFRVRFAGGLGGGFSPPNDFLTPESPSIWAPGGVDSNPSVSVTLVPAAPRPSRLSATPTQCFFTNRTLLHMIRKEILLQHRPFPLPSVANVFFGTNCWTAIRLCPLTFLM